MVHVAGALQPRDMGFWEEQAGRRGEGVVLYTRERQECMELCQGIDDEPGESLWVRISRQTNMGDIVVGVCY